MKVKSRKLEILKEKISEIIPDIENSINDSNNDGIVVIDQVEISYSSAQRMLEKFKKILSLEDAKELTYGIIPMKLLVSSAKMKEIQIIINQARQEIREEFLI